MRISIGSLAGMVAGFGLFLYAQIAQLHDDTDRRFEEAASKCATRYDDFEKRLDDKADKTQAADRYTGAQAREREKRNEEEHEAIRREIDHIHNDLNQHLLECRRNHKHEN